MARDYSDMTYERIMERCLQRVPDTMDKREGSIIYDALAPAAAELATYYTILPAEMDRAFPDTAEGDDLTNKAKERGVFRLSATAAVRRGTFTGADGAPIDVPIGCRFSGGAVNYAATQRIEAGQYQLTAEEPGAVGNTYFGTLFPIDFVEGLTAAQLGEILIYGEDEETDDALRARYMTSLTSAAYGGNIADYRERTEALPGVGLVKVFPAWNGGGTVKLVLVDSAGGVPSGTLIDNVQTAIDPVQNQGADLGIAPIGHVVTVEAVAGKTIDVSMTLTLAGVTWQDIKPRVQDTISEYLQDLIAGWADADNLIVRLSQIESRILDVQGVVDIAGTTINGGTENIVIGETEIPVLGVVENVT